MLQLLIRTRLFHGFLVSIHGSTELLQVTYCPDTKIARRTLTVIRLDETLPCPIDSALAHDQWPVQAVCNRFLIILSKPTRCEPACPDHPNCDYSRMKYRNDTLRIHPHEGHSCVNCQTHYRPGEISSYATCRRCGENISVKKPFPWWIVILGFFALVILFGHK